MIARKISEGRVMELVDNLLSLVLETTRNGRDATVIVHKSLVQAIQLQGRNFAGSIGIRSPYLKSRSLEKLNFFRAIANLPREFRAAMILSYIEGFSYEQIANLVGISSQVVESVLTRGRALIRRELYEYIASYGVSEGPGADSYLAPDEFEGAPDFS